MARTRTTYRKKDHIKSEKAPTQAKKSAPKKKSVEKATAKRAQNITKVKKTIEKPNPKRKKQLCVFKVLKNQSDFGDIQSILKRTKLNQLEGKYQNDEKKIEEENTQGKKRKSKSNPHIYLSNLLDDKVRTFNPSARNRWKQILKIEGNTTNVSLAKSLKLCEIFLFTGIFNIVNDAVTILGSKTKPRKYIKKRDIDLVFKLYNAKYQTTNFYPTTSV